MPQVNSSYDYIIQTDWCLLQTFFSSSHSIYIAASLKEDSSNLHNYWYDLHPFQIMLSPQIEEFLFQIPKWLFGFHCYFPMANPAQQKTCSAIFFSDKIPFIWALWFSPQQWGSARGKENKKEWWRVYFENLVLTSIKFLLTWDHWFKHSYTKFVKIQVKFRLTDSNIYSLINASFSSLENSNTIVNYLAWYFRGLCSIHWSLSCIFLQREVLFFFPCSLCRVHVMCPPITPSFNQLQ